MRRRQLIVLIISGIVTRPFAVMARQQTYRLGCLLALARDAPENIAFFEELRRRGFVEGQNLTVEYRAHGLHLELISQYAAELVNAQVDVIIARGDDAIRAAQQATKTIPILAITGDMLGSGLVNSLVRPNGNTTGVSMLAPNFDRRRQHILIEAVPGLRRMAALVDVNNTTVGKLDALQVAARARNIELSIHRIARGEEIAAALDMAHASGAAALNVLASPMLFANRQLIMNRVAVLRLPAIYQWPETVEEGGLAAYGPRFIPLFRELLARQVVELFRGIKVADIPIEQPTKFELVINLKTAKALGNAVPPTLLVRADKVIE
jgi:putative tryptophan/tyrosine transport system substrate-binding protein